MTINPDGHSIKGCSLIYAPAGQAGEYAKLACNPYRGCGHACVYCYVPSVLQMSRTEFDAGAIPRSNFIQKLTAESRKYQAAGITEQVMLSFTTDPYHPGDTSLTRETLKVLQAHGLGICTLTKGGTRALRDIDLFRPERDAFASTLTSLNDAVSLEWEAKAALPQDRLKALKAFHDAGIFTWVSLDPVYDTDASLEIIRRSHEFVSLYKIGRINYHRKGREINWEEFTRKAVALFAELGAAHYVKKDLQPFLPAGYSNPKYINQANGTPGASVQGVGGLLF